MHSVYWQTDCAVSDESPTRNQHKRTKATTLFLVDLSHLFTSFEMRMIFFLPYLAGRIICQSQTDSAYTVHHGWWKLAQLTFISVGRNSEQDWLWNASGLIGPPRHVNITGLCCYSAASPPQTGEKEEEKQRPSIKLSACAVLSSKPLC